MKEHARGLIAVRKAADFIQNELILAEEAVD